MTSKLSKVVGFPTLLTWKANSMFGETWGREDELVGVSLGFAVHSCYSRSSGMVGSCQQDGNWEGQGWHCCVGTGMPDQGLWWCHFPCPHPTALSGVPRVCSLQRASAALQKQLLTILTLWQHCWGVLLNQCFHGKAQALWETTFWKLLVGKNYPEPFPPLLLHILKS